MMKWSRERVKRFAADESGLIMTEFLILLPLLVWAFMALVVYWDTWRTINEAQKASYAIADLVSRQSEVNISFINGMETVMEGLLGRPNIVTMRITSVQWNYDASSSLPGSYALIFSRSPNNRVPQLTLSQVQDLQNKIPVMNPGDTTVVLETWTAYRPGFDVGIPVSSFGNFIVTKPRYYRRVCLFESPDTCPARQS